MITFIHLFSGVYLLYLKYFFRISKLWLDGLVYRNEMPKQDRWVYNVARKIGWMGYVTVYTLGMIYAKICFARANAIVKDRKQNARGGHHERPSRSGAWHRTLCTFIWILSPLSPNCHWSLFFRCLLELPLNSSDSSNSELLSDDDTALSWRRCRERVKMREVNLWP